MSLVTVRPDFLSVPQPQQLEAASDYCASLERGDILFFPATPISFAEGDLEFLRAQKQSGAAFHKNIAYRPLTNRLTGYAGEDRVRMQRVMSEFSRRALAVLRQVLAPYRIEPDFASFRPLEEQTRKLKLTARNDLLHVDSFPTRPTYGRRILRFFVNIHPTLARVWRTGPPFPELARRYAGSSGLLGEARRASKREKWLAWPARVGIPVHPRPAYDRFMMSFHNWLKANSEFQGAEHERTEFSPMSSWIVFTDTVSHAVLSGQYALEQTVFVARESLLLPEIAPVNVLGQLLESSNV